MVNDGKSRLELTITMEAGDKFQLPVTGNNGRFSDSMTMPTPMSGVGGANIAALAVDQSAAAGVSPLTAIVVPGVRLFTGRPSNIASAASNAVANWMLEPVCALCAQLSPTVI